jgi:nitroreductase
MLTVPPPSEPLTAAEPEGPPPKPEVPFGADTPIFAVMSTMRAMRRLSPEPVPDELVRSIVEAATWAPSGSNVQGLHFVVVTDRERMARIGELWRQAVDFAETATLAIYPTDPHSTAGWEAIRYQRDHFAETPVLVVACYDERDWLHRLGGQVRPTLRGLRRLGPRRAVAVLRTRSTFVARSEAASIYPAVENLLLAARAHGLAACLTTWPLLLESEFNTMLGIPKGVKTYAVVPIGWPLGRFGPVRRKPVEEVIHRETW